MSAPLVAVSDNTTQKLLKVLERISKAGLDCGCSPCVGQCRCDEANEINLQGVRDLTDRTLAEYRALAGQVAPQATVEPLTDGVRWDLFPGWLIDHCEGDIISEEGSQFALADMLRHDKATPPTSKATEQSTLSEIQDQLTRMLHTAAVLTDAEFVTGYQIKTGALHSILGTMQGAGFPVELPLPQNTMATSKVASGEVLAVATWQERLKKYDGNLDFRSQCMLGEIQDLRIALAATPSTIKEEPTGEQL